MSEYISNWPKAYSPLNMTAQFRTYDKDFQVRELSDRALKDEGPHLYLKIQKTDTNTHWLARKLANHAKIDLKDVGYAGLKDRHAITQQWFSLPIKNKAPDLTHLFEKDEFQLIQKGYYGVKLKRGALGGNAFKITLRNVVGDQVEINQRLELIRTRGVPNYFGEQRFGHDNENLLQAQRFFETGKRPRNRQKTSMYLSAARSYLFNKMLAKRVEDKQWDRPIDGEVFGFAGSLRGFSQEHTAEENNRWRINRIHPTCALWGKGDSIAKSELLAIEQDVAQQETNFAEGLEKQKMKQERRATRLLVPDLYWAWEGENVLTLEFSLASGYFATSVLRELGDIKEAPRVDDRAFEEKSSGEERS